MTNRETSPAGAEDGPLLYANERAIMDVVSKILKALNQPFNPERIAKKDLPAAVGTTDARINAILNPKSEKSKKFSLDEIGKVVAFARGYSRTIVDSGYRKLILDYCNQVTQRIHDRLDKSGLSPTENAFVTNLRLDDREQDVFSDRHSGVYAVIRLDRAGHILISRMDVYPREAQLCRFATKSPSSGPHEPLVEGYIYSVGDTIQSVGRPATPTALRTSILRSMGRPGAPAGSDMIGLRLGMSDFDGGPFAYRIYCRRIAGPELLGQELPDWEPLFGVRAHEASDKIAPMIRDIVEILQLLQEEDDATPWGVGLPTGIER